MRLLNRNSTDGIYRLKSNASDEYYDVYCHMTDIEICGKRGWTLIMKLDGNKVRFHLEGRKLYDLLDKERRIKL